MLTAIVLVLFALTAVMDWLPDIRKRPKKETVVYGLLWSCGLAVLFLYSVGVAVPSPSGAIRSVVEAIFPVK
jgi:cytochrome b561